jgi:hypothetical protein
MTQRPEDFRHQPRTDCPVPNSHERYSDAHFYLHQMLHHYHHPNLFRWSFHAFIQAIRAGPEVLKNEIDVSDNTRLTWLDPLIEKYLSNPVVETYSHIRDGVVKKQALELDSPVSLCVVDSN